MDKVIYALLTTHCNLSCPYCDVKNNSDNYNRDKFIDQLNKFDGRIILFGGEPTMYPDRLIDIYFNNPELTRKISSISTNLMVFDDKVLTILQCIRHIASSWNPDRFVGDEYERWLHNLEIVNSRIPSVDIRILVTLTNRVLDLSPSEFNSIISHWNYPVIKDIMFEHYIGDDTDEEYFKRCDEWLCDIYNSWESPIKMENAYRDSWYYECNHIYTLKPDGTIINGCPHVERVTIPDKCYSCDKSDICRPCRLQHLCSYPHKFMELTRNTNNEGGLD